jgi:hypothetical protein
MLKRPRSNSRQVPPQARAQYQIDPVLCASTFLLVYRLEATRGQGADEVGREVCPAVGIDDALIVGERCRVGLQPLVVVSHVPGPSQLVRELVDEHEWVQKSEVEGGQRPGVPSDLAARLKALERENRELRQANEILRKASAYFAQAYFAQAELDRRSGAPSKWHEWQPTRATLYVLKARAGQYYRLVP